jgi:hypothetical protein
MALARGAYRLLTAPHLTAVRRSKPTQDKILFHININCLFDGGRTRARTLDPLIKSQLLYQLSYAPIAAAGRFRSARAGV